MKESGGMQVCGINQPTRVQKDTFTASFMVQKAGWEAITAQKNVPLERS